MSTPSPKDSLFTPVKLGDHVAKNRIHMAALTRNRAPNTVPGELMKEHFVLRVRGGAGLIVTDAILISRQGTEWENAPGLWNDEQVEGWKTIVDAVHAEGGLIYAQLWHTGRVSHPDAPQQKLAGVPVYAPSAIAARGGKFRFLPGTPGYVKPTAIDDPTVIIEQFRHAAVNAKKAGFDGVEVHGANGYIITQFLESGTNVRTDKWGGSVENRARFPLEVLKVIKESFGVNVAIKLSPAGGYNDVGMPLGEAIETYKYFIEEADKLGLAFIVLCRYCAKLDVVLDGVSRATQHDVFATYGPLIKHARVVFNGDLTPEEAADFIKTGTADAASFGIPWITHPDLAKRIEQDKPLDNQPNFLLSQYGEGEVAGWVAGYNDYPVVAV